MGIRKVVLIMKPAMCLYHDEKVVEWLEKKKARMKVVYLAPGAESTPLKYFLSFFSLLVLPFAFSPIKS